MTALKQVTATTAGNGKELTVFFFVDIRELIFEELVTLRFVGEVGLAGGGGVVVGGAEGFEDTAGVVASAHGHAAGAGDLKNVEAGLTEDLEEAFDFAGGAGHLEHDGLGGEVDDAGAEDVGELEDLGSGVLGLGVLGRGFGAGGDLDEAELADDGFGAADLVDVLGDFEFVERGSDAVGGMLGGLADDGHAGGVGAFGFADGEGDDVDVEAAEEGGDAGEDAGLVLD